MPANLRLWPANACLISELAEHLLTDRKVALKDTLIILPTQRLQTLLAATLAKHLRAFFPPQMQNLEDFILQHGRSKAKILSDLQCEALLSECVLNQPHYRHLKKRHAHELLQLFAEIHQQNVNEQAFADLNHCIQNDIYRSDVAAGALTARAQEIALAFKEFSELCEKMGSMSKAQALNVFALELKNTEQHLPYSQIYVVGFTSMSKSAEALLAQMLKREQVHVWLHSSPKILATYNPLHQLTRALGEPSQMSDRDVGPAITLKTFDNCLQECQHTLATIANLRDAGVSPSRMAILLTNESIYAPLLMHLVSEELGAVNFAVSLPFRSSAQGRFLSCLCDWFSPSGAGFGIISLLAWLSNPITLRFMYDRIAKIKQTFFSDDQVGEFFSAHLLPYLHTLPEHPLAPKDFVAWAKNLPPLLKECLEVCFTPLEDVNDLATLLAAFPFIPKDENPIREVCQEFLAEVAALEPLLTTKKNLLWQWVSEHLLSKDLRSIGEPLHGLQVLRLSEARLFPFEHVFILGANEGNLPPSLPKDELLDDYLKRKMGLAGWQFLESTHELTFHLLLARIPNVHLFASKNFAHEPLNPSPHMQQLSLRFGIAIQHVMGDHVIGDGHLCPPVTLPEELPRAGARGDRAILSGRREKSPGPQGRHGGTQVSVPKSLEGVAAAPTTPMSATSLEHLIHCPYRYLIHNFGVRKVELQKEKYLRIKEGQWLHRSIQAFLQTPLSKTVAESLNQLMAITETLGKEEGFSSKTPLFYHLRYFAWPKLVEHLHAIFDQHQPLKVTCEKEFNTEALQGAIDQTIEFKDMLWIIDYKRNYLPSRKNLEDGSSPQLPFYALGTQAPTDKIVTAYWSIMGAEWQLVSAGSALSPEQRLPARSKVPTTETLTTKVLDNWRWREVEISTQKRFFADPSACGLCDYAGVCRKDDPLHAPTINQQDSFNQRFNGP